MRVDWRSQEGARSERYAELVSFKNVDCHLYTEECTWGQSRENATCG